MPYMRYPVDRDRATGFLIPTIGCSGRKGFNYEQGFYWAIARNMDATFSLDYYAARGLGGGLNFRYIFRGGTEGEVNLYGFTFKRDAPGTKQDDAYILRFNHNQPLPLGFNLVADVDLQSSYDFLREFDNNFRRAIVSQPQLPGLPPEVVVVFQPQRAGLAVRDLLRPARATGPIISKSLPEINFSMFKVKLFGPLYVSFASGYSRQEYGWQQDYDKGRQRKTGSLSFAPTLSAPFTAIPWLTLNTSVTGNFVYYPKSYAAGDDDGHRRAPLHQERLDHGRGRRAGVLEGLPERGRETRSSSTASSRSRTTSYDSPIPESKRIITTYAYFFRYHQIEYGLTNRFYVKDRNDQPRELVQVGLGQTFYLAPEEGPLSQFRVNGKVPRFSEIRGAPADLPGGAVQPGHVGRVTTPITSILTSLRLSANAGSRTDGRFVSLSWFKSYEVLVPRRGQRGLREPAPGRGLGGPQDPQAPDRPAGRMRLTTSRSGSSCTWPSSAGLSLPVP